MTDPERDLADFTYGKGWGSWMEDRVSKLESLPEQLRVDRQKLDDIKRGIDKLGSEWVEFQYNEKKKFAKLEKRLESLESDEFDDQEEITGVQSVDKLQRNARSQRARTRRWKRNAKIIAPILVGAGAALVEFVRAILAASGR